MAVLVRHLDKRKLQDLGRTSYPYILSLPVTAKAFSGSHDAVTLTTGNADIITVKHARLSSKFGIVGPRMRRMPQFPGSRFIPMKVPGAVG